MNVRRCLTDDLKACAALFAEVFAEPPYFELWRVQDACAYLKRFWQISPDECFVATKGSEIEGAIFGYSYPWQNRRNYFVHELYVRQIRRKSGVGRLLLEYAVENAGPGTTVSLIANERTGAAKFYEALGLFQHPYYKFYSGTIQFKGVK
ncbi:MAG: GNAT family N-acetyltransferase [Anaerolineae bacterium]|nr:GNAT family N-acetyltransferase [Anaerolineae bacterium]